ncbi:transposase [Streptococcus equinus]|uniref:ISL3 family transposase n=1 Tax=Streptococcus equinus TaxID=1335 RepID=UPI000F6E0E8A|nr:ISL3 family transposase [Streptococcus equinus]VEE22455.1 transposase [Streptococcus equinus]
MELLKNTTDLIGLKDKNISILCARQHPSHIEIKAKLDYTAPLCPHCQGTMIKYDFQKESKIPILDAQGMPTVLKLKKRRFQCKACKRVTVSETPLVKKIITISEPIWKKITESHTKSMTNSAIADLVHVSISTVQRKLVQFTFKENYNSLPEALSWDEFARNKGKLAFIAQDYQTRKIITILENNRQTTIKNYFYQYSRKAREAVKVVTCDMSGAYIPIIKQLFPNAKIVLDRFHIIQHLNRAMMATRIVIMKQVDKRFYSRTLRETITPKEIIENALAFSDELSYYYELYQLLLFHFQEKNRDHFFSLIQEHKHYVNPAFKKVFQTFIRYKDYITNALEMPYSNARLEATNKLIKDIKRQAFGFRNFDNFKTKILITLNIKKERTKVLSRM